MKHRSPTFHLAILTGAIFAASTQCQAQANDQHEDPASTARTALSVGEKHSIKSDILGEDRPYMVFLPDGCREGGANAPCPVLYVLDGGSHFHYGSGMLARMSESGQIPDMLMVAIPNGSDRGHDLTPTHTLVSYSGDESPENATSGGANTFLDFLERELIPEVEHRYKPMPFRVLSGHSLGGLTALHSFIERPDLFQAYIAVDPSLWWDDMELVKRAESILKTRLGIRSKVFIALADHGPTDGPGAVVMEHASERFAYALKANPSPHLHSGMRQFTGESHLSVAVPGLYYGLLSIFDGFSNPPAAIASQNLERVVEYYRDYLGAYGIALKPPGDVLTDMAQAAKDNGETQKAIEYLEYNVAMHPDSPYSAYLLAIAYKDAGEKELAIRQFQRVLELAPHIWNLCESVFGRVGTHGLTVFWRGVCLASPCRLAPVGRMLDPCPICEPGSRPPLYSTGLSAQ
jgi:hypothetical protein